jgi:hypothetical protein
VREGLAGAEGSSGARRRDALTQIARQLDGDARTSCDAPKVRKLTTALRDLAGVTLP